MRDVSDDFLLNMAEVSATLIGLFLVGVFFFVETGFRRMERGREIAQPYFRAGTRIVLILYAISLGLSLTLVALGPVWNRIVFALMSCILVAANIETLVRVRGLAGATGSRVMLVNEVVGTAAVVVLVLTPWVLGGLHPTREDLTWAILLAFGAGFVSVGSLVLSVFDSAAQEPGTDA